jgi:hypothetical protein
MADNVIVTVGRSRPCDRCGVMIQSASTLNRYGDQSKECWGCWKCACDDGEEDIDGGSVLVPCDRCPEESTRWYEYCPSGCDEIKACDIHAEQALKEQCAKEEEERVKEEEGRALLRRLKRESIEPKLDAWEKDRRTCLQRHTLKDLREFAKFSGFKNYSNARKPALITALITCECYEAWLLQRP